MRTHSRQPESIDRRIAIPRRRTRTADAAQFRAGFTMTELIVSMVLLGALLSTALPTLRWVGSQQHAIDHRQVAMLEAENIIDQIASQHWNQITPEFATALKISAEAQQQLPDAKLEISITPSSDANAKRISLALNWLERKNAPAAPVRLTTWVYRRGRSQ